MYTVQLSPSCIFYLFHYCNIIDLGENGNGTHYMFKGIIK